MGVARGLLSVPGSLLRHRAVIAQLVQREVVGRYRGSFLGLLWPFLHPLLMLSIYTFVFGLVFKSRWRPVWWWATPISSRKWCFRWRRWRGCRSGRLCSTC